MTGNTDWHAPKGTPKTKTEWWWEAVRPYHEQGRKARQDGVPLSRNPLCVPYDTSWAKGWQAEDTLLADIEARQREACADARRRQAERDDYDMAYPGLAEKLSALGIDPYQLRDYLAGLPSEE